MDIINHYLKDWGTDTFWQRPLNDLDIVALNELVYLPFNLYFQQKDRWTLIDLCHAFNLNESVHIVDNPFLTTPDRLKLFYTLANSPRFANIICQNFTEVIDPDREMQFCAMTFQLKEDLSLISYRGTDDTLIGWKEDLKMAYQETVPAQLAARDYFENFAQSHSHGKYILVGHSKGGNLALFAAVFSKQYYQDRIQSIYCLDSPGLQAIILKSQAYKRVRRKIKRIVPEDSLVGYMLFHDCHPTIIKSHQRGFSQHDCKLWRVQDQAFIPCPKNSRLSQIMDQALKIWVDQVPNEDLDFFVEHLFQLLDQMKYTTLNDLEKEKSVRDFLHKLRGVFGKSDPETRRKLEGITGQLLKAWHQSSHQWNLASYQTWKSNLAWDFSKSNLEVFFAQFNFLQK
ncbi:Mbeg1-like protein [Eremococcus coleocola]|uniref:Mbeg1-like protein n=1 Tax=Eremococcus coleocola TaxID=88132 RepID=UPI00040F6CBD|nr:Mbeg1-like protein [Eremococcus coleocola]